MTDTENQHDLHSGAKRLLPSESVKGATVQLIRPAPAPAVTATTNHSGVATLATTGVPNGTYTLTVTPANTTADAVGPTTAISTTPDRIFRSLQMQVTLASGRITAATVAAANRSNGTVSVAPHHPVAVTLQPVWMRSPNWSTRGYPITGIIIHHTGGPTIGGALHEWLGPVKSIHYVIDTDGQIVKLVPDNKKANQAGVARWNGDSHVNARTIGIEIVNKRGNPYHSVQYAALITLLSLLRRSFPTIVSWNVVGHSDVATNPSGRLGRKSGDPGDLFEWSRVEAIGLGMSAGAMPALPTIYAGFFVSFPGETLRPGDNDASRRFGGAKRPALIGNPIVELQTDLKTIGYSVGALDGDFGDATNHAAWVFKEHFFAGGRGDKGADGRINQQTAMLIKAVVMAKAAALVGAVGAAAGAAAAAAAGGGHP